jgi:type VI secretion system secreted protein VgrG
VYDRSRALLQLDCPLGPNALIPIALSAREGIGTPYAYSLALVSEQAGIDPDQMLHQRGCVTLRRDADIARYFSGVFQEFAPSGTPRSGMASYSALIVPRFWFLCQTIDCRIFQEKSVVDILQQMFDDAGVERVSFRVAGERTPMPYTTQFNETDFQFATRLMEQAGYFYFFEHDGDGETLVIADNNTAFSDIPQATLRFDASDEAEDVLVTWRNPGSTAWGSVSLRDYDPTAPTKALQATDKASDSAGQAERRDVFRWPAVTFQNEEVSDRARRMIEASAAAVSQSGSSSTFRGLVAGGRFTLKDDPLGGGGGGAYVVTSLSAEVIDETWDTAGGSSHYSNSFACLPDAIPWRQQIATARPTMAGIHAAVVLGPEGEEIHTDDLGRVKVRFFWDWRRETNAAQAVWARVMQPWAGNQWGAQFIPRVGTEVAVAFVDNDPDRPIVLGGLYNANQTPIYSESEKTKSGFRSRSTIGGGRSEFNEFTFDDKKGSERVYLRGQKDLATEIRHNASHSVGNDRSRRVGNDETVSVAGQQTITVTGNRQVEIKRGNDSLTVDEGDITIESSSGNITVRAMQSITLSVGNSTIRIDPGSISIEATSISISGAMVSIEGDGETSIEGGIVSINS